MWLEKNGHQCPITDNPLTPDDIEVNDDLVNEIIKWRCEQMMDAEALSFEDLGDDEDALYDF